MDLGFNVRMNKFNFRIIIIVIMYKIPWETKEIIQIIINKGWALVRNLRYNR